MITIGANSSMNSTMGSLMSSRASFWMVRKIARSIALDVVAQATAGQRDERVGEVGTMHAEVEHADVRGAQLLKDMRDLSQRSHLERDLSGAGARELIYVGQLRRPSFGEIAAIGQLEARASTAQRDQFLHGAVGDEFAAIDEQHP